MRNQPLKNPAAGGRLPHRSLVLLSGVLAVLLIFGLMPPERGWTRAAYSGSESVQDLRSQQYELERQRRLLRQKKQQTQRQVRAIDLNIGHNQQKLEVAQQQLNYHQGQLQVTQQRMGALETRLEVVAAQARDLAVQTSQRLREIYTGGRLSMLEMVLDAKDIATLLDRLYYRQKMVAQDKALLSELRFKTRELQENRQQLQQQKQVLAFNIVKIGDYKNQVSQRLTLDRQLRERYARDAQFYEQAERQLLAESASITMQIRRQLAASRRRTHTSGGGGGGNIVMPRSTGIFAWPLYGQLTSGFGSRFHPIHHRRIMHTGLDIAAPKGRPVGAADGGEVLYAGWRGGYGKVVMINHNSRNGQSVVTLYGHLSGIAVGIGQTVGKGQTIGYVGSTGYSTGPHLHFEIRLDGVPVNPMGYL